jgi:hypothetical protein
MSILKKTFFASNHRDSFCVMQSALEKEGYQRIRSASRAELVFLDHEARGNEKKWEFFDDLARVKPVFLFPHTPYTPWLWFDYIKPSTHVACNFAPSEAYASTMLANGYPCRVENVGFTRPLTVKPFSPTAGRHLAFALARLIGARGRWPDRYQYELMEDALKWIIKNRSAFERVTIFYTFDTKKAHLSAYQGYGFEFVCVGEDGPAVKALDTRHCLDQLRGVDLFIGCHTIGFVSISQGIPTILYGHGDEILNFLSPGFDHSFIKFPLQLQSTTPDQALDLCRHSNPAVEAWKQGNIGSSFDERRFLEIIHEFV